MLLMGKRIVALATVIFFTASTILWSAPAMPVIEVPAEISTFVPVNIGTVQDAYLMDRFGESKDIDRNQPLIIHLQDAHTNVNAQWNIAKLIEYYSKKYGIKLVAVEGTDGMLDVSPFQSIQDRGILEKLVKQFVEKRLFTGAEAVAILNEKPDSMIFRGVEDRNLYIRDLALYRAALKNQTKVLEKLSLLEKTANRFLEEMSQKRFRELLVKREAFEGGVIDLLSYLRFLDSEIARMHIEILLKHYPILGEFMGEIRRETKDAGFELGARAEEIKFVKHLDQKVQEDYWRLKQKISEGSGEASSLVILAEEALKGKGESWRAYPKFQKYLKSFRFLGGAPSSKLFEELEGLESDVAASAMILKSEKYLWEIKEQLRLARKVFELKLVPSEYEGMIEKPEAIDFNLMVARLEQLARQYHINETDVPSYGISGQLDESLKEFLSFYAVAKERDQALIANLLKTMADSSQNRAIIITGGFHAKGIGKILREKDYAVASIASRIVEFGKDDDEIYRTLIQGELPDFNGIVRLGKTKGGMFR